jgi:hypothetical protein
LHVIFLRPEKSPSDGDDACTGLGWQVEEPARTHALPQRPLSPLFVPFSHYQPALLVERSRVKCPLPDIELASIAEKAQRIDMSDRPLEAAMDRFVTQENIKRYRKLASESTNAIERSRIMTLLAEAEAKFKLELSRSGDAPGGRSPDNAATEKPFAYDREEQRGGG